MSFHQVIPKIYHTYSKIWVNRDFVIRFWGFSGGKKDTQWNEKSLNKHMQGNAGEHFVVALFPPFTDVVVVHTHQMAALGENECDRKLKRKSPEISEAYDNALAFLHSEG